MLILTRRVNERIHVGDEIEVIVLGVRGNQVRLGIEAPAHVAVDREEIYKKKQQERRNRESSTNIKQPNEAAYW